jgi:hypothetical protein
VAINYWARNIKGGRFNWQFGVMWITREMFTGEFLDYDE